MKLKREAYKMDLIIDAAKTSLVDKTIESNIKYRPKLLYNDYKKGMQMLNELQNHLTACDTFDFSIAFIASSGLACLKQTLLDLKQKGIKGRIITSTYLGFNEPKMFEELLYFDNIEVRLFSDAKAGFHPKGYIFKEDGLYNIIVGSSNLSQTALQINKEWNLFFSSTENGGIVEQIQNEFEEQWNASVPLTQSWIEDYKKVFVPVKHKRNQLIVNEEIRPNKMQEEALSSLASIRKQGKEKALLISATGTGKTYLSAFDVAKVKPERLLFIIHRENIARAAMKSFKNIMSGKTMSLYTGTEKGDADYLFATVQTMSNPEHFQKFAKDEFDYIIIDEVHHLGAQTYQRLVDYFKPKFLLGMTATPERSDAFDIFRWFDYNIAYEIRLQQAMEYDLLCPFHYYGITDLTIDNEVINDYTTFNTLVSDLRVNYIIENMHKYGYSGTSVKGLIFCSRNDEASKLSQSFNERGFRTIALSGATTEAERRKAMDSLESEDADSLQYIFTVDIFNEGVDIPAINQVVMLRPTASAIVFVQQLGRGLRKHNDKDYVVVIDFIGNYEKNFLIPIALSGSLAYNKDDLRHFISEGSMIVPGCSTINFDRITKERIYQSIDAANFNDIRIIKDSYKQLKEKLGHIPKLIEFDEYGAIDPLRIFNNKSLGSYHVFLKKYDKADYKVVFNKQEEKYLNFVSLKLAAGKRVHELEAIKVAIEQHTNILANLHNKLKRDYNIEMPDLSYDTITNILTQNFMTGTGSKTFEDSVFITRDGNDYVISNRFKKALSNNEFKEQILEVINFGIHRYYENYVDHSNDSDFVLNKKYTYEDACRLLNWDKNIVPLNIGGYKYDRRTNTFPVFINYDKEEDISETTRYEDHFIDQSVLIAYSKSGRNLQSDEVVRIYNEKESKIQIHLFVRKNKDDSISKEFYYLGKMHAINNPILEYMPNTNKSVVRLTYQLEHPIKKELYDYITM